MVRISNVPVSLPEKIVAACRSSVGRVVHISALVLRSPGRAFEYQRSKAAGEERIRRALRSLPGPSFAPR